LRRSSDLVERYSTSNVGGVVAAEGVAIPVGWYSVDIFVGWAMNGDDFALDFVLRPCRRAQVSADLGWLPNIAAATPTG